MKFNADEIASVIQKEIEQYKKKIDVREVGRVLDPLGNPLDGKCPIVTNTHREVESPAPGIADRQPVRESLCSTVILTHSQKEKTKSNKIGLNLYKTVVTALFACVLALSIPQSVLASTAATVVYTWCENCGSTTEVSGAVTLTAIPGSRIVSQGETAEYSVSASCTPSSSHSCCPILFANPSWDITASGGHSISLSDGGASRTANVHSATPGVWQIVFMATVTYTLKDASENGLLDQNGNTQTVTFYACPVICQFIAVGVTKTFDMTLAQAVSALNTTKGKHDNPPDYILHTQNCTDVALSVAAAAGLNLGNCQHSVLLENTNTGSLVLAPMTLPNELIKKF